MEGNGLEGTEFDFRGGKLGQIPEDPSGKAISTGNSIRYVCSETKG